jgi:hypothetical protein
MHMPSVIYAESILLSIVILDAVMLSDIILDVVLLNVVTHSGAHYGNRPTRKY